jgi:hypothetical protein
LPGGVFIATWGGLQVTVAHAIKTPFERVDGAFVVVLPDEMREARAVNDPEEVDKKLWDTFDGHAMVHIFHGPHFSAWIPNLHCSASVDTHLGHQTWALCNIESGVGLDVLLAKHRGT